MGEPGRFHAALAMNSSVKLLMNEGSNEIVP